MKKKVLFLMLVFVLTLMFSCLPTSIYPASSKKDSIIDSTLIGDWKSCESENDAIIRISLTNDSLYSIVMYENINDTVGMLNYLARVTKIDSFYIASLETDMNSILKNKDNLSHISMISSFFFIRYRAIEKNKINYSLFNFPDKNESLSYKLNRFKTFKYDDKISIVTDSIPKVRELLKICIDENIGFDEEEVLIRIISN